MLSDPIAALATPPGRSAVAVVRLSGEGALAIAARIVPAFRPEPRLAQLATFVSADGTPLDRGLYTVFPAPHSYTGDDLVEFSCHGGLVAPARLLEALHAAGARPAAPGEFTRRAVLNGRLDLLQAEAVGDLIDATAPLQARRALAQLDGNLSNRIGELRTALVELQSLLGYDIDFPDEDDGPVSPARLRTALEAVVAQVERLLATAPAGERLRDGALVVLAGQPNVGKSSLFNALLGSDRALVTEIAGTTRDAIESPTTFDGWPIRLVDTAGLRETEDRIERMGVEVSRRWLEAADLVILCVEAGAPTPEDAEILGPRTILARTKSDLAPEPSGNGIPVSALTGDGLERVRRAVVESVFGSGAALADLEPALSRERHRAALARAADELAAAEPHLHSGGDPVLASHHVRLATLALDELIGAVDLEEVLDRVFLSFCVGK
ncbi:MAG TPA: tRNA uridine-5-carboxymethylaminomethyl(34) synthesis GTPase MnmE [Gemmatimonadales bacterium]|nr:tRNA uridine-5-carboxymethylaminomethyl(34) synthesis GTPase MnmE [Gemmatimonadales bacterium]